MTSDEIYEKWQKLCEEHSAARDAHFKAMGSVTSKFAAIAQGKSEENPGTEDLSEFEKTWQEWEAVKNKMSEFVKKHA